MRQEEAIRQLETRLAGWDNRIHELEAEIDRIEAGSRNRFFRDIQELKEKRDAAEHRLTELKLARAESWSDEDLQAGIFRIFDDIGTRVNRLVSRVPHKHH